MPSRRLILVRHAKAGWPISGQPDFDRTLTDEGWRDAERMGAEMARRGVAMDAVVASPAPRAFATAVLLAGARETSVPVQAEERLYEAPVRGLSEVARGFDDGWHSPWLIGHNPGLSHFADWLLGEPTVLDLPTCAVVYLEVALPRWNQLEAGCATLRGRWSPKDLR